MEFIHPWIHQRGRANSQSGGRVQERVDELPRNSTKSSHHCQIKRKPLDLDTAQEFGRGRQEPNMDRQLTSTQCHGPDHGTTLETLRLRDNIADSNNREGILRMILSLLKTMKYEEVHQDHSP